MSAFDIRTISDREAAAKLVKIGVADCILARYDRISSLSPLPLRIAGAVASTQAAVLEQGFHEEFDELRSHGEWFHHVLTKGRFPMQVQGTCIGRQRGGGAFQAAAC